MDAWRHWKARAKFKMAPLALPPPTHHPPAGTETEERIQKRLTNAVGEMEASKTLPWDGVIVNDDVGTAYAQLRELTAHARAQRAAVLATKRTA